MTTTVLESKKTRNLLVVLPRGADLLRDLVLALDQAEVKSAWLEGTGSFVRADLAVGDAPPRRVEGPIEVVSLSGIVTSQQGQTRVDLSGVLARETDVGLETLAGRIVSASVRSLSLLVTALEDVSLGKLAEDTTPRAPAAFTAESPRAGVEEPPQPMNRRYRPPADDATEWPEPGDLVSHFHFGECAVISSDGERIRLRQEGEGGRVREVALTMLKIEMPTVDPASGKRHFRLNRKN